MKRLIELLTKIDEMGGLQEDEFEELVVLMEKETKDLRESHEYQKQDYIDICNDVIE